MKGLSDIELLDAYAARRSEEAFRELVTRHVDFTYSAAMRLLRNPHLAQEAAQSAFIALAGKAGRLPRQTVIAGWLHHAVHFAALHLQRSEARRKHWEEEAAAMSEPGEHESDFPEHALPHVDGALDELGDVDRDAILLRFLQQKSFRDVAEALGTSEDAAKKRVGRALEKLRDLLARRGVTVSAVALAAGLSQLPVNAAPALLASTVSALAVQTVVPAAKVGVSALLATVTGKIAAVVLLLLVGFFIIHSSQLFHRPNAAVTTNPANPIPTPAMKIRFTTVMVDDQAKALKFYTEVLGFVRKADFPAGAERWSTVVSPLDPDGTELILEPISFEPARTFQAALFKARIPLTAFQADDVQKEFDRLTKLGVKFRSRPIQAGPTIVADFEDTCGNRIQLFQAPGADNSTTSPAIRLSLTSVIVPDQEQALKFYTEKLGFVKKEDMPAGGGRWLTVVSPDDPDGTQLLLEPMGFAPAWTYQAALHGAGIPYAAFLAADVQKQYEVLAARGVEFITKPTKSGRTTVAVFDDTCGNFIQIVQP